MFKSAHFISSFNKIDLFFSLIYFAERDSTNAWSFPDSFWWGMLVLTSVGPGDISPESWIGRVIMPFFSDSRFCQTK